MAKEVLSVPEQIKVALDGRTQRWLSLEVKIPESDLSKKMNNELEFNDDEIKRINDRLKSTIKK